MGNVWSSFQSTNNCSNTLNCGVPTPGLGSATSGAGIGTLVTFTFSAGTNVLLSLFVIASQWNATRHPPVHLVSAQRRFLERKRRSRTSWVLQQIILNFSDQQLITGLAMAITTRFFASCNHPISAYHYDLVCYLLTCSVITHLCCVVAINDYFDPISGSNKGTLTRLTFLVLRCLGITITIILTGLILFERNRTSFPVIPPKSTNDTAQYLLRPAACFFVDADNLTTIVHDIPQTLSHWTGKSWSHGLIQYVIFILAILTAILTAIPLALIQSLHNAVRNGKVASKSILVIRLLLVLIGLAILIWTMTLAWSLRRWIHDVGWLRDDAGAENTWTFSQVLPPCMILFAPFTMFDSLAEKFDAKKRIHEYENHVTMDQLGRAVQTGSVVSTDQLPWLK